MWKPEKTQEDIEFSKKIRALRHWDWETSRYPIMASHRFIYPEDCENYRKELLALAESDVSLAEFRESAKHLSAEQTFKKRTIVY